MTVNDFISEWQNDEPFITANTSGSTGTPKEILLDKEFIKASALRTNAFFGITSSSRLHLPLSPDYIAGKMMIVRALEANATLSYETPSNTPLLNPEGTINLLSVVPSQMKYLIDNHHGKVDNYLVGGSAISPSLKQQIISSDISAWESYGMTETASHIALRPITSKTEPFISLPGIRCSLGKQNNLIITMPRSSRGTETIDIVTRDVAQLIDSEHFFILGRLDNTIITGGVKVHPEQVEAQLATLNWPFTYFIGSIPDHKWTAKVTLFIDASTIPETGPYTDCVLAEQMRTVLKRAELPRNIIRIPHFHYTETGKLIRKYTP